ncbi:GyrI-like domain-containing protein [Pseudomonas sp. MAFF 301514]|uniref:GyrI-like domain-containing protein n=1 Tax=Pseudomonas allii TaxID=2740531 RepID=A0A7Y8UXK7_9PSED|nr:GyrI-like domain-containing protein [Pseudomonas allii]NWN47458.1 GyrI-like domain-containing protein [Pseudomonas allii]NWN61160.1 GyrI-like domain-containing protein [Pseudomonas allii]
MALHNIQEQHIAAIRVSGLKVRTRNADEMTPSSAKIGPMWQRFFSEGLYEGIPGKPPASPIYGVYSGYESDAQGEFDVMAGVATAEPADGFESQVIEAGRYLVFEARGQMPEAIISTWQQIWTHFQQPGAQARAFVTDFEAYQADDLAWIHIGIR